MARYATGDQVDLMKMLVGINEQDEEEAKLVGLLPYYLDQAASRILNRQYPFGIPKNAVIEDCYLDLQMEIAVFLWGKRGMEGESLHSENGISRSFGGYMDLPAEFLQQITPKGRVM